MREFREMLRPLAVLAATGAIAAVVLVAGCSAAVSSGQPVSRAPVTPQRTMQLTGPAGSQPVLSRTRREARALARRILARLVLPPGAQPVHPGRLPQPLRRPSGIYLAGPDWVDARSLFQLSESAPAVQQYLLAHHLAGAQLRVTGQGGGGTVNAQFLQFSLAPPAGFEEAELVLTVIPHAGGSLLRADGQVVRFPPRTAAEHLAPGQFKVIRLAARVLNPRPRTLRRVITSPKAIARLARLLNGFPAAPHLATSCPGFSVTYTFTFAATARRPAKVVFTDFGCRGAAVRAGGKAQPALQDTAGKLYQAAQQLIPVKTPS